MPAAATSYAWRNSASPAGERSGCYFSPVAGIALSNADCLRIAFNPSYNFEGVALAAPGVILALSLAAYLGRILSRLCGWRNLLILLAILSLGVSLATRTFHLDDGTTGVQSSSTQAMRQHLDRDGLRWIAPVPTLTILQTPAFYPHVAPAGPPLPSALFEENLYNRPPPTC